MSDWRIREKYQRPYAINQNYQPAEKQWLVGPADWRSLSRASPAPRPQSQSPWNDRPTRSRSTTAHHRMTPQSEPQDTTSTDNQWKINASNPNSVAFVPIPTQLPDKEPRPKSKDPLRNADETCYIYPLYKKGPNYLKYCRGRLSDEEIPSSKTKCVRQYMCGHKWHSTDTNTALKDDSRQLSHYANYIKQLKYSIGVSSMNFSGTVFHEVDMSSDEVAGCEAQNIFFIPSFLSTSKRMPPKDKNTLVHIDISPDWSTFCMEIKPKHVEYEDEDEVLFSCYNLYKYRRTEKSNGQRVIKLELMDYDEHFDYRRNRIVY